MYFSHAPLVIAAISASAFVSAESDMEVAACSSAASNALPAMEAIPTANKTLREFIAKHTPFASVTGSCVVPIVTGSLADDFTSWVEQVYSWQSQYLSELTSLWDACTNVRGAESYVTAVGADFSMFCPSVTWLTGTRTATTADQTDNAAPRETGMGIAAAAAVAGMAVVGMY